MQGVRDYIKYIKRGYSRPSHLAALDIRHGRIDREQGEQLVARYEGRRPPSLDLFLDFIGLTEEEFVAIAMEHQVSPYVHDPQKTQAGERLADFDHWSRAGAMPREEALVQLTRWRTRNGG
jgi:hypothetical protein